MRLCTTLSNTKLWGYEVSLRHSEADQIEVLPDTADSAQVEDVEYEESEQQLALHPTIVPTKN